MRAFPPWIYSILGRRIDELEQVIAVEKATEEKESFCFEQFWNTLNSEQRQFYMEWEEQNSYLLARKKESLYVYGFLDGIQVASIFFEQTAQLNERKLPQQMEESKKKMNASPLEDNACDKSS